MSNMARRWGDDDRNFGPFTYSRHERYRSLSFVIASGEEEYPAATIRLTVFTRTFISIIPAIIRPWREWVDTSKYEWSKNPKGGYWAIHPRQYGFALGEGYLQIFRGAITHDSQTDRTKGYFLPWTQWRHVRHSYYGLAGEHITDEGQRDGKVPFDLWSKEVERIKGIVPTVTFAFRDYDGEALTATTRIEEREWHRGEGWFKWLSWFVRPKITRSLDIRFSGETGERKGSWKGGTIGHSITMEPDELHEAAFRRYCKAHRMEFVQETKGNG